VNDACAARTQDRVADLFAARSLYRVAHRAGCSRRCVRALKACQRHRLGRGLVPPRLIQFGIEHFKPLNFATIIDRPSQSSFIIFGLISDDAILDF